MTTAQLTSEQRAALAAGPVLFEDETTNQRFILVDEELHHRAMDALRRQEDAEAIRRGIEDMEAGRVTPHEEVDARIRAKYGQPAQ